MHQSSYPKSTPAIERSMPDLGKHLPSQTDHITTSFLLLRHLYTYSVGCHSKEKSSERGKKSSHKSKMLGAAACKETWRFKRKIPTLQKALPPRKHSHLTFFTSEPKISKAYPYFPLRKHNCARPNTTPNPSAQNPSAEKPTKKH